MAPEDEWLLTGYDDALSLLERRGIATDCPVCGAPAPSAPALGEEPRYVALSVIPHVDDPPPPEGFKQLDLALAVTCGSCGFVRLLSANVLNRLREQDAGP